MKNPPSPKERNLLKGAIRRVFSRSDLRKQVIDASIIQHINSSRPKVKTWCLCAQCRLPEAKSYMQVDHIVPLIPLHQSLEDLDWNTVVDRTWCDVKNLQALCKACHKVKSKIEAKERRRLKKCKM